MYEKVNPSHPDKLADQIAGALVDLAYKKSKNPRIAVEVLLGHGVCHIVNETSIKLDVKDVKKATERIAGDVKLYYLEVPQDTYLAKNQEGKIRCGDNGIFKGTPITSEQEQLSFIAHQIYDTYKADGKYILDKDKLVICQSNAKTSDLEKIYEGAIVNPLGEWSGGITVDTGATNRKLGSDMGDGITGGGLHGKDLSKADVSVNIYAFLKAQETGKIVELSSAIGDEFVDGVPFKDIVEVARTYISMRGGFEQFAKWGLI